MRRAPDPEALAGLNEEFGDLLVRGRIRTGEALEAEDREVEELPRVFLEFDRRRAGGLRALIDRLNELVPEEAGAHAAAPHEVFERPLPPEAQRDEDEDA